MSFLAGPEVSMLATCLEAIKCESKDTLNWEGSPFAWIKTRSSRQRGAIGEMLVSNHLVAKGFDMKRSPDSEADRLINGVRAEIKLSTLWQTGSYRFQQLRDQNYEFAICLGISPFDAHCWVLPKDVIMEQWEAGGIRPQHRGKAGQDTAWLLVDPGSVPEWLQEWGGGLSEVASLVRQITG